MVPYKEIIKDNQENLPEIKSIGGHSLFNSLVLKYFIHMGYYNFYSQFCFDLNIPCKEDPLFMRRSKIREFIELGEIDNCVSELNDLDIALIQDNIDIKISILLQKGYELSFLANKDEKKIIEVIEFLRLHFKEVPSKYEEELENLLEYLIFNSDEINIEDRRVEMADRINKLILIEFNVDENDLEKIIEGIFIQENELSKTNKFNEFKSIVFE